MVIDMEGNIRIDTLPLGHGTNHETDISIASGLGNLYILILPSISVTII